jgi:broad specificity phosphatase PhoE
MTSFLLVRHGQTDWNLAGRWQGQSPDAPPLNQTGRAQVLALRNELRDAPISAIYASDLLRTRQTAELLAKPLGLQVIPEPRLREMDLGEWEGMLSNEIKARYPRALAERARDPVNTQAPGGEALIQVVERCMAAADEIAARHPDETVMVVAHGVSLAALICLSQGLPLEVLYENIPENARSFHIEWRALGEINNISPWLNY